MAEPCPHQHPRAGGPVTAVKPQTSSAARCTGRGPGRPTRRPPPTTPSLQPPRPPASSIYLLRRGRCSHAAPGGRARPRHSPGYRSGRRRHHDRRQSGHVLSPSRRAWGFAPRELPLGCCRRSQSQGVGMQSVADEGAERRRGGVASTLGVTLKVWWGRRARRGGSSRPWRGGARAQGGAKARGVAGRRRGGGAETQGVAAERRGGAIARGGGEVESRLGVALLFGVCLTFLRN